MNFDFGEVLRRTWKVGWNHKVLWVYQMLPGLAGLLMMPLFVIGNPGLAPFLPEPFNQTMSESGFVIFTVIATAILIIPIMFLSVLVQGATTFGALEADKGTARLSFRETIKRSLPYFWRLFGLYALFGTAWALVVIGFVALNIGVSFLTFGLGTLCMIPMFLLLVPFLVVGYSILELAQAAIITDDMNMKDAISKSWQMFRINWLAIVLLMLMLYFALTIISMVFVFPLMFPMMLFPIAFETSADLRTPFMLIFFVFFPIMMLIMTAVQGILMAFFQSAWLVAYRQLDRSQITPVFVQGDA